MDRVDLTLQTWRREPHQYGVNDCVLSAAAFWGAWPEWAGTYCDSEGAMALLAELGGMDEVLASLGGVRIDGEPRRGDFIGLVTEEDYPLPALCTGDRVVARLERGIVEMPLRFVRWTRVWRGAD